MDEIDAGGDLPPASKPAWIGLTGRSRPSPDHQENQVRPRSQRLYIAENRWTRHLHALTGCVRGGQTLEDLTHGPALPGTDLTGPVPRPFDV
jgi:hypothetical protein